MSRLTSHLVLALLALLGRSAAGATVSLDPAVVSARQWDEAAATQFERLLDCAASERMPDIGSLTTAYCQHALCALFAKAAGLAGPPAKPEDDVVGWLLANPALAGTLALALQPEDDPPGVMAVLRALMPRAQDKAVNVPDLYVAFAVVWDGAMRDERQRGSRGSYVPGGLPARRVGGSGAVLPEDPRSAEERLKAVFAHLVGNAARMRVDLGKLPWEFARYVVDSQVSDDDRAWALAHYAKRRDYGPLYNAPFYDIEYRKWKPGAAYTLENIRRYGGVCVDRAYFAANVAKACGLPSIAIAGPTSSGVGHAWVMMLWGGESGNYRWSVHGGDESTLAFFADPQTGQRTTMRDAHLLAATMSLPTPRRLAAAVYYRTADLLREKLMDDRVLDLLEQAARNNPYDTRTWLRLSEMMGRKEAATYEKAGRLYAFLLDKFRDNPEFTRDILRNLLPLIPEDDAPRRCRLYEATYQVYRKEPDIAVELMTDLADYLRDQGLERAALFTYRDIIHRHRGQAHLLQRALDAAEALCRKLGRLRDVVEMYEEVDQLYRNQKATALYYGTSTYYYRFAQKLLALYRETGNAGKAEEMSRRVERIDLEMQRRGERRKRRSLP